MSRAMGAVIEERGSVESGRARVDAARLLGFLGALTPFCLFFGLALVGFSLLHAHERSIALAGAAVLLHAVSCLWGRRLVRRGRPGAAVVLLTYGSIAVAVIVASLIPEIYPVAAVVPLAALAFSVPYAYGQGGVMRLAPLTSWGAALLVTAIGTLRPQTLAPHLFWIGFEVVGMAVVAGPTILLVLRFGARLREDLSELQRIAAENARLFANAEQAVRARDEFLSVAGHELRTPVAALNLQVQNLRLALQPALGSDARIPDRLSKVDRSLGRLTALIDDVLDVSRITAGRLQLSLEDVDLAALVRDVVARQLETGRSPAPTVEVGVPQRLVGRWDRLRLDQVVSNLVSNALKYGGDKPVHVRVEELGGVARLTVRDEGIGIPRERQAAIFGRFERAVSERNYGGFGLGLWISRECVAALGGEIRFESEVGKGTTFIVELPVGELASDSAGLQPVG
ncbi:MAG: HAMP domain-containing histidine kinase [Deltaproteobacteria bacterium]|nr:HAMP domain-containing histidine kinase [Deltaproteobacteria bacterium]